ncbi:MAG: hypothetical protein P4L55_08210 [Syntrophobacteraceae bacterium]|nr:hypothetical protein [Syntrophobacteraceae bacterium]
MAGMPKITTEKNPRKTGQFAVNCPVNKAFRCMKAATSGWTWKTDPNEKGEGTMATCRVEWINEAREDFENPEGWILCLQWCLYVYDDGSSENGYRFIWRQPKAKGGRLLAARGQTRIPSQKVTKKLWNIADKEGWGGYICTPDR